MRNWIFAAVIGLSVSGQAWAWDDDERIFGNGRYRTMAEWQDAEEIKRQIESDRTQRQFIENEMLWNQEESLRNQKKMLEIERERLEIEKERAFQDAWVDIPRR